MGIPAKISPTGQIRIPKAIREKLHLDTGDYLEFDASGGKLIATPKRLVEVSDAWFWSKEWQEKELEADEDIRKGRYKDYDNIEALIGSLDK